MLGKQCRDKVTGFEGIAIGKCTYLYGCDQIGLLPPAKDNKVDNPHWFDIGRIEVIGPGINAEDVASDKPGCENNYHP